MIPSVQSGNPRFKYVFTGLWFLLYCGLFLSTGIEGNFEILNDFLIYILGLGLTVLAIRECSGFIPEKKMSGFLFLAGLSWWVATMLLTRSNLVPEVFHPLNSIALVIITITIGLWLAGELEKAGHLIPVGILGLVVDIWSVFLGPSKAVIEKIQTHFEVSGASPEVFIPPPVVQFLLLGFPQVGNPVMRPVLGFGDLVFIALFFGSALRFGLSIKKAVILVVASLVLTFVIAFSLNKSLPALPFICGFFILGNLRELSITPKEWKLTLTIAGAFILFGILTWLKNLLIG